MIIKITHIDKIRNDMKCGSVNKRFFPSTRGIPITVFGDFCESNNNNYKITISFMHYNTMVTNKVSCIKRLSVLYGSATGSGRSIVHILGRLSLPYIVRAGVVETDVVEIHRGRQDAGVIRV